MKQFQTVEISQARSTNRARAALIVVVTIVVCSAAHAQSSPDLPSSAPIARQIVPLIEPLRRKDPGVTLAVAPAAKHKYSATHGARPGPIVAAVARTRPAVALAMAAANPIPAPAPSPQSAALPAVASATTAEPAAPTKIAVYTCHVGEDYSIERKTCFIPGVTAAGTADKSGQLPVMAAGDTDWAEQKSALGAKRHR